MSDGNYEEGMGMTVDVPVGPKKAAHVKWAGKTIALGTFPVAEAEEKCQKAKALTRAWRSSMRPKPSREWVMLELERRNVRVVSGRSGKEVNDVEHDTMGAMGGVGVGAGGMIGGGGGDHLGQLGHPNDSSALSSLFQHTPDLTNLTGVDMNQMNGLNFGNNGIGGGDIGESNNLYGSTNPQSQPADAYTVAREDYYRKLADKKKDQDGCVSTVVSDGSNSMEKIPTTINNDKSSSSSYFKSQSHRHSLGSISSMNSLKGPGRGSLGLGSLGGGGVTGGGMMPNNLNISVNANQHYEMLKLHHMNLLNEIHETTLMMNMHQQHQLQLQQQQHQQEMIQQQKQQQLMDEASTVAEDFNGKLSTLASVSGQQGNFSGMQGGGGGGITPKPSSSSSSASIPTPELKAATTDTYESYELTGTSQNKSLDTTTTNTTTNVQNDGGGSGEMIKTSSSPSSMSKSSRAEQLRKIQEEIAERQMMLEELESAKTDERTEDNVVNSNYHHDDSTGRVESDRAVKRIKTLQWETNE